MSDDQQLQVMRTMMSRYVGVMGVEMMDQLMAESASMGSVVQRRMVIHRCLNLLESVLGANVVAKLRAELTEPEN